MLSNRLECHKVPRLPGKTTWQPAWKPSKRRCFTASLKDTATPQENKRLEARHVGAEKRAFRARPPPLFTFCSFKIDVFLRGFLGTSKFCYFMQLQNQCFVRSFRPFSAHVTKCHACHEICTLSPLGAALPMRFTKNTQHDTSKVLRLPRKMQHIFWNRHKSIAPPTQNGFQHITKHVWMSRSATPATRNEATAHWKPPKMTTSAELPIGTARPYGVRAKGCGRLRTVADGCDHKRNVEGTQPQPPEWSGNPCYAFGKKTKKDNNTFKKQKIKSKKKIKKKKNIKSPKKINKIPPKKKIQKKNNIKKKTKNKFQKNTIPPKKHKIQKNK